MYPTLAITWPRPIWPTCATRPSVTRWPAPPAGSASREPAAGHLAPGHPSAAVRRLLAAGAPGPVRDPRLPRQHWHSAPHPPAARGPGDVAERDARSEAAIKPMA